MSSFLINFPRSMRQHREFSLHPPTHFREVHLMNIFPGDKIKKCRYQSLYFDEINKLKPLDFKFTFLSHLLKCFQLRCFFLNESYTLECFSRLIFHTKSIQGFSTYTCEDISKFNTHRLTKKMVLVIKGKREKTSFPVQWS